jgi:fucose permease
MIEFIIYGALGWFLTGVVIEAFGQHTALAILAVGMIGLCAAGILHRNDA